MNAREPGRPRGGTQKEPHHEGNPLDIGASMPRWLSVDQIRKLQRCRRETVVDAMLRGDLPFEQRGRIRYARLSDVIRWEEHRLRPAAESVRGLIHPDLEEFV